MLGKVMLSLSILALFSLSVVYAEKERNEDGFCDEVGNNHDDNNPSEKRFKEHLNKDICELSDCIDSESCEGKIKDWSDFKQTVAYESANEMMQICFKERYDLPPALQDYEVMDCAQGNY